MTTSRATLLITTIALILLALVPAVSAEKVIWDYTAYEFEDTSGYTVKSGSASASQNYYGQLYITDISLYQTLAYIVVTGPANKFGYSDDGELLPAGVYDFTYSLKGQNEKRLAVYIERYITGTKITLFFNDWDIGDLTGIQAIDIQGMYFKYGLGEWYDTYHSRITENPIMITYYDSSRNRYYIPSDSGIRIDWSSGIEWQNHIYLKELDRIDENPMGGYEFSLTRIIDGIHHQSDCKFYKGDEIIFIDSSSTDIYRWISLDSITKITVESPTGRVYEFPVNEEPGEPGEPDDPGDPGEPGEPSDEILRTGSVTMTDHNGTTITGFEVTAVNHYTGEEYTVSTDTDVAVISLPMDRTVEIRNPQTGVYEEAPVGYYRFYGQAPGYKMLNEEGIKVAVMPEKYGSYKLCDILVTSESGPLSGKHQFQIRSRADNSVLQTGTISAQSATTGIWYNTTVVDGLATLILPYDTSDALSEYAGHYYVYATSPGYEDSDYGTQIIVSPRTVSEVKTILLTPIGGIPTPGKVTLRIDVFSEGGSGVPNAEIFIKGVIGAGKDVWNTYTASSSGYLEVSVPGNSTYDIVASGAGYYDSARRIEVFMEDPPLIEIKLYLSGAPIVEPTVEPTDWPTGPPTTQPTGGIPDEDDGSDGFLMQAVRGIGNAFGVGFSTAKIIFGMLLALAIGFATAKELRGGAAEFGLGLLGGTMLGILVGLIPVWTIVVLLLIVGLYIGHRYVGGGNNG